VCKKIHEILDNLYSFKKPYMDLLSYVKTNQDSRNFVCNYIPIAMIQLKYSSDKKEEKEEFEEIYQTLINCGYMSKDDDCNNPDQQLKITADGRNFLQIYSRFKALGVTAKFTEISKQCFTGIISLLAIIISLASLFA
jgi:hypothetical protein